ncbi:MAG: hypothetical protein K2Y32_07965 [Candidatus Obscuribacterales bacterium]|nr:hypothetical protein [Candidatus Obscuribacterales bacterium]
MSQVESSTLWFRFTKVSLVVFVLCLLLLFFGKFLFFLSYPLLTYADQAFYLQCGKIIMAGGVPYRDVFDWNPPLIMYLAVIPILLSSCFRAYFANNDLLVFLSPLLCGFTSDIFFFNLVTLACGCYAVFLSMFLLYRYKGFVSLLLRMPMLILFIFYFCMQSYSFGEREHLHFGLVLPLFVLRLLRLQGKKISILHSVLAALPASLTLLFKPQFLLAYCAFEATLALQAVSGRFRYDPNTPASRQKGEPASGAFLSRLLSSLYVRKLVSFYRQPEFYCLLAVTLLYAGWFFFVFPPDARTCFLQEILPLYDSAYGFSRRAVLLLFRADNLILQSVSISFAGLFLGLLLSRSSAFAAALSAFLAVSLLNFFYGNQVWLYRLVPSEGAAFLVLGEGIYLFSLVVLGRFRAGRIMALALVYMLIAFFFCAQTFTQSVNARRLDCSAPLEEVSNSMMIIYRPVSGKDNEILWFGTGISPGFPAILQLEGRPGSRYVYSILAQVSHAMSLSPANRRRFEPVFRRMLAEYKRYIVEKKPKLIVVQRNPMQAFLNQGGIDLAALGYREVEVYKEYSFFVRN